jgi:hypothetical protein
MKQNSKSQAGTTDDSSTKDHDMQVSQHSSKPPVLRLYFFFFSCGAF